MQPARRTTERAYIDALAKRYVADPKAERAPLDRAYADAMREVVKRFPDDLDAATLFAQSLMDTSPWNYWEQDGSPRQFTNEVIASLESVLARKDDHAGAIHLYIHAVEASPNPGRAEKYADKLAALVPGAGHLVHMPGHIYLRTGRYNDASMANVDAIKADEAYFAGDAVAGNMTYQVGYYPHNIHFFVASASLEGRRADALKAADDVRAKVHADMMRDPAMGGMMQHMHLTPLYAKVRFSLWDQVLAEPAPADDLPYMRAMWHAARGLAHAAQGRLKEAEAERTALAALKDDPALKTLYVSSVEHRRERRGDRVRSAVRRDRGQAEERRPGREALRAGGSARGRAHVHGAARLADSRSAAAGRRAAGTGTRWPKPRRRSATT